jgi:hypothetical protein
MKLRQLEYANISIATYYQRKDMLIQNLPAQINER